MVLARQKKRALPPMPKVVKGARGVFFSIFMIAPIYGRRGQLQKLMSYVSATAGHTLAQFTHLNFLPKPERVDSLSTTNNTKFKKILAGKFIHLNFRE